MFLSLNFFQVDTDLPNCQMLHSNLAVAWSVFAPSMTIQLIGNVDANDYIGFGFSEPGSSKMVGSDVAIAYVDGLIAQVDDYNITAKSPCTGILGVNKGVCRDEDAHVSGTNDNQIQTFSRDNGITKVCMIVSHLNLDITNLNLVNIPIY